MSVVGAWPHCISSIVVGQQFTGTLCSRNQTTNYTFIKMQNRNKLYLINCCWNLGEAVHLEVTSTTNNLYVVWLPLKYGLKMVGVDAWNGETRKQNGTRGDFKRNFMWLRLQWNELRVSPQLCSGCILVHWYRRLQSVCVSVLSLEREAKHVANSN